MKTNFTLTIILHLANEICTSSASRLANPILNGISYNDIDITPNIS